MDKSLVKSELVDKKIDKYIFDILLDYKFPFQQPQIFCRTPFSNPPLNDGRDLFNDVLRTQWKIAKKLYEIIQYIPEFISEVKISEEEGKLFGTFHVGFLYELSNWGINGIDRISKVFECEEQDEINEEVFYSRIIIITQTALLVLEP